MPTGNPTTPPFAYEAMKQKALNGQGLRTFRDLIVAALDLKADTSSLATVATSGSYNDLSSKPTIPTVGTLNTNNTTAQTASSSESLSGAVSLHKVSKTGSYNDLLNKPTIPTATSDLTNDSGFITTETDPTVPAWAKASSKPTYTASEVGALPSSTVIPSKTSDLTNDSGFVNGCKMYIGTCETAAAINPKVCEVEAFPLNNGEPYDGTVVCVKFTATDTSTSTSPTINVNGTGAKRIWYNNALLATAKSTLQHGYANRYIYYVYDSSLDSGNGAWVWLGCGFDTNTTYTNVALGQGYATDTRSSAVTAVTASLSSYTLTVGGIVAVKFAYNVPANATLNINSKGAKAIYNRDAPIGANVIKAGDTATFIYTTYYRLISLDRSEGADLTNYYTKTEVDTALSGKQATLVSGTNLKTINNESLLGSGNISIEGGGSANITYNANTQALVIGGGSMTTYSVTSTYSGDISSGSSYYNINDGENVALAFPITVNEGDKLYCKIVATSPKAPYPYVKMGNNEVSVDADEPGAWQFTISSVIGDIVISDY